MALETFQHQKFWMEKRQLQPWLTKKWFPQKKVLLNSNCNRFFSTILYENQQCLESKI